MVRLRVFHLTAILHGGAVVIVAVDERVRWEELMEGSVLRWVPDKSRVSTHIVAFDMDGTLIKTKSGVVVVTAFVQGTPWHSFCTPSESPLRAIFSTFAPCLIAFLFFFFVRR